VYGFWFVLLGDIERGLGVEGVPKASVKNRHSSV
jgi:hypothetical protein